MPVLREAIIPCIDAYNVMFMKLEQFAEPYIILIDRSIYIYINTDVSISI